MAENFRIDKEVSELLLPPTTEEYSTLEQLIELGGHVDPGVVAIIIDEDGDRVLADGHNRRLICRKLKLVFPTRDKTFSNRDELLQWVIDNQFGRRNLTEERKSYYRGCEYRINRRHIGNPGAANSNGETAEKVAEKHRVSRPTIERDAAFSDAVDNLPEAEKHAVLNGHGGLTKKEISEGAVPILCERCRRVGAVKDCETCETARVNAKSKPEVKERSEPATEPVPVLVDEAGEAWQTVKAIEAVAAGERLADISRRLANIMTELRDESLWLYTYSIQTILASLKTSKETILGACPAYNCPYCVKGKVIDGAQKGKPCGACRQTGWVTRQVWRSSPKGQR